MVYLPRILLTAFVLTATAFPLHSSENQRFSLTEEKPKARFEVTEISWPAQVGEASLCLWHDDRLAALSVTIDDNCAPDIPWWREKAAQHGFRATWFVITGRISGANAFNGTWAQFQQLLDEGHEVESHTVEHLHTDKAQPDGSPWSIDWEYTGSLQQLHANLKGRPASTLAYPGGKNKTHNDRALAAKLYRSARGGAGMPNAANTIDYLNINGMSSFHFGDRPAGEKPAPWSDLNNIINPSVYNGRLYRGWAVVLTHLVNDKARPNVENLFRFIDANRDKLWVGLFTEVAKYGQQRDTASLAVTENTGARIQFSVTDKMDDAYFDQPLTVKLRVPDAWASVAATQAGKPVPVRRVVHAGAAYALVHAIPDRGPVAVTSSR